MNSPFTGVPSSAPDGVQVAFIQGGGTVSQLVSGFQANASYVITFSAIQRTNCCNTTGQDIAVYVDSTQVGTFHPSNTAYVEYSTAPFSTTTGAHTIKFAGLNLNGDQTAFMDKVRITGNPKPGFGVQWLVTDQLGTPRLILDQTGSLANIKRHDYLPFGEELFAGTGARTTAQGYSATDGVRQQFTAKERDGETGLDFFEARYYGSNMGHFTSTDPGGLLTQNQDYPQSWNLYEYVHNNPLTNIDPTGLDCVYANDAGNGVESIDHHSSPGECRQTGGSWVPGYANERWAYFNDKTNMFQVGSLTGWGTTETVNYTMFEAGAQTQFNANETACTGGCSGFSQANADWLQAQFVGKSIPGGLDKYIEFLATRDEPIKYGIFMKILAGPLAFWRDHWAGMGGFGPPGGQGDWAATVHDYNWNLNGPDEVHGINIRMGLNPRLKPEVSKAFIQSNSALYRHAGGLQGAKMRLVFGVVNVFQKITH